MQSQDTTSSPASSSLTFEQKALQLLDRGFVPMPLCWPSKQGLCACGRRHEGRDIGKAPLLGAGWEQLTADDVRRLLPSWRKWPWANAGILLEPSGLVFVGGDSQEACAEVLRLGQPPSIFRVSANTGMLYHRPLNCQLASKRISVAGSHIDIKSNGYAVAWGRHKDGPEVYLDGNDLADAPAWAIEVLGPSEPTNNGHRDLPTEVTDHDIALAARSLGLLAEARCDDYDTWIGVGMALHYVGDVGLALWERWSKRSAKYEDGACVAHWDSFDDSPAPGKLPITLGSLFHWARADSGHDVTLNPVIRVSGSPVAEAPSQEVEVHHVSEALDLEPPIPWVVCNMIAQGSVGLVVGAGGSKKTYALLDLAVAVALGQPWLSFETVQCNVLVVDEESGNRRLKRRLGEILRGRGAGAETPLWYTTVAGFNLRNAQDAGKLERIIEEKEARLVIVDALVDVMPAGDENAAQDVHPVFRALRFISERQQCVIIMIHHANRGGGYRGSSAMQGAVDMLLMARSCSSEQIVSFESDKVRDTEDLRFSGIAEWDSLRRTFRFSATQEKSRRGFSDVEQVVIDHFVGSTGRRSYLQEVVEVNPVYAASTLRGSVAALAKRGYLLRTNPREKKAEYKLTDQTQIQET